MKKLTSQHFGDIEQYTTKTHNLQMYFIAVLVVATSIIAVIAVRMHIEEPNVYALSCSLNACNEVFLTPMPIPTTTPIKTQPTPISQANKGISWTGKVSHYSRAGCLGCSPTLTMANGEPLDDSRFTIAFNKLPMNTQVKITNLDNGKSVIATVTDTGGFERLGRIADLVPAVANALETRTDVSTVLIEQL